MSQTLLFYTFAAVFEIAGCFAFWAVLRLHGSTWLLVPGLVSLVLFAVLLTKIDLDFAGRTYAAYGGIYITASLLWLWVVEDQQPDRWDLIGAGLCLAGALIILLGRHPTIGA